MILKKKRELAAQPLRSACIKPFGGTLAPLIEGPTPQGFENEVQKQGSVRHWIRGHLHLQQNCTFQHEHKRLDLRKLLGVLGAPLGPVPIREKISQISPRNCSMEKSSANYILQQYLAAVGITKLQKPIHNSYAMGRMKIISSEFETVAKVIHSRNSSKAAEFGCFVLWQMVPDMWSLELAFAGSKIFAGSNGNLVWRHTPWSGTHAAKGPIRPLRRVLQGLDPRTIANTFASAQCDGEKKIGEYDCFVLRFATDSQTLAARSDGPAEIIRHVLFGYFSQRTGLLVRIEDSHLTKIQVAGREAVYWETTIESTLEDYRVVDGLNIAHAGVTIVTLFRFGEVAMSHTKTRMEEVWNIEEFAHNVPGLSADSFIPPDSIIRRPRSEAFGIPSGKGQTALVSSRYRESAADRSSTILDNIKWRVEV
ncbi:hypothetical protein O6H91_06G015600 [Diphasiastrum complanatum]|uniref:Uncharacterized protein n=2 Tax=Diphasiastrum complanatum TaxID=34168 RepID=A0ACC2DAX8_DIPCM|nr:hypothetical protein O6H91_06G015600 [Diphasiastrum complanatum]KAJ7551446.1 hypothetical protein O6H91_06G015600 [Diphasiastrum complanatum]